MSRLLPVVIRKKIRNISDTGKEVSTYDIQSSLWYCDDWHVFDTKTACWIKKVKRPIKNAKSVCNESVNFQATLIMVVMMHIIFAEDLPVQNVCLLLVLLYFEVFGHEILAELEENTFGDCSCCEAVIQKNDRIIRVFIYWTSLKKCSDDLIIQALFTGKLEIEDFLDEFRKNRFFKIQHLLFKQDLKMVLGQEKNSKMSQYDNRIPFMRHLHGSLISDDETGVIECSETYIAAPEDSCDVIQVHKDLAENDECMVRANDADPSFKLQADTSKMSSVHEWQNSSDVIKTDDTPKEILDQHHEVKLSLHSTVHNIAEGTQNEGDSLHTAACNETGKGTVFSELQQQEPVYEVHHAGTDDFQVYTEMEDDCVLPKPGKSLPLQGENVIPEFYTEMDVPTYTLTKKMRNSFPFFEDQQVEMPKKKDFNLRTKVFESQPLNLSANKKQFHQSRIHDLPLRPCSFLNETSFDEDCNKPVKHNWRIDTELPVPKVELTVAFNKTCAETLSENPGVAAHQFEPLLSIIEKIADGNPPGPHITMKYELLRICTLRNYPKDNKPFLTQLAAAGFYYAAEGDEVICYCCGLRRQSWSAADVPERIHQRINPNCKFLNRKEEFNVPVIFTGTTSNLERIEKILKILDEESIPQGATNVAEGGDDLSEYAIPNTSNKRETPKGQNNPKHAQYVSRQQRISSFEGWPDNVTQTPEIMSEAGFYYAGFGDCVRCFYCGIGLRHWNSEDNPWIEHARWSQHCAFLKQVKGQDFINLVHMAVQYTQEEETPQTGASGSTETASKTTPSEKEQIENILRTDAAQSVLEMGYAPKVIKKAIEFILKRDGRSAISSKTIMEKVLEYEEAESAKNLVGELANMDLNRHENSPSSLETPSSKKGNPKMKGIHSSMSKGGSSTDLRRAESQTIKEENERMKEQALCKICMNNSVCIVFLPCGHLCTCDDCAPAMRICPICRSEVKGTVKTYMTM